MSATIDLTDVIIQIEKIQAMVFTAHKTIEGEKSHECDMASIVLMDAMNRMFALKESLVDVVCA